MSFNYKQIRSLAGRQISMFGQDMILRRVSGEYDPTSGFVTDGPVKDHKVKGILTKDVTVKRLKGSVLEEDRWILLEAESLTAAPSGNDLMLVGSETWSIVHIVEVNPGGVPLLYMLQVRK